MMAAIRRAVVLAVGLAVASAGVAVAGQPRPYRVSDQQLKDLANRIDTHRKAFDDSVHRAIGRSSIDGTPAEGQIDRSMKDFEQAANLLRARVNDRQSSAADAENVLRRASVLDDFMTRERLDASAQRDWQALRRDMDDLARAYGITERWSAAPQDQPQRVDDREVEQLLKQIEQKAQQFDKSLDRAFDSGWNGDRREKDGIRRSVKDFRQATKRLRERVNGRQGNTLDVEEVLRRGEGIDASMQRHQLSAQAEQNWLSLGGDLDRLARAYNVSWNWRDPRYTASAPAAGLYHGLTGTYQLDRGRGDDPRRAADLAARAAPSDQRQRIHQNLLTRLDAPELLAIERNANGVTMASTRGPRVSFEADGRNRQEPWAADATVTTRATFEGERLVVATTGTRDSDYTVTFDPVDNGRSLQMTRTIHEEGLRQPVTVRSFYRRTSDQARWDIDAASDPATYGAYVPRGDVAVPDGTRLTALLDNALSPMRVRQGDPFTLTIRTPGEYEGATVQGIVSAVHESGPSTDRAGLTLNLRSIRLRNGSSYRFDGVIEGLRTPEGNTIRVDREGTVDAAGDSQTQKAVERAAIGAALGAIIGAVTGGGKGAAIGAVVGAAGGSSTVLFDGRDRADLPRGTEVTITSGERGYRPAYPSVQR